MLVVVFKQLIGRDRPVFDEPLMVYNSYSFPSGHAAGIAGAVGVTIVLTRMLVRRRGVRRLVLVLSLVDRPCSSAPTGSSWACTTSPT